MFRIYYYIFGLDRKIRYVSAADLCFTGRFKLSKEKTSFHPFGWLFSTINCKDFDDCVKQDAKEIYETYKCPAYATVEYQENSSDTGNQIIDNNDKAVVKTDHFNHLFRDEYQKWLKSARQ